MLVAPTHTTSASSSWLSLPNTQLRLPPVQRHLITGLHTVADLACGVCGVTLGWKYIAAADDAQRYKVGKFILEGGRVAVGSLWEEEEDEERDGDGSGGVTDDGDADARRKSSSAGPRPRNTSIDVHGGGDEGWDSMRRGPYVRDVDVDVDVDVAEVEFDSQDSDECEDLFAGIWSPRLALARRRRKRTWPNMGMGMMVRD